MLCGIFGTLGYGGMSIHRFLTKQHPKSDFHGENRKRDQKNAPQNQSQQRSSKDRWNPSNTRPAWRCSPHHRWNKSVQDRSFNRCGVCVIYWHPPKKRGKSLHINEQIHILKLSMEVQLKTTKSKLNLSFHVLIFQILERHHSLSKKHGACMSSLGSQGFWGRKSRKLPPGGCSSRRSRDLLENHRIGQPKKPVNKWEPTKKTVTR